MPVSSAGSLRGGTVEELLWNLGHIPLYGVLTLLWGLSISSVYNVILVVISVAVIDEVIQGTTPGRTSSITDLCLDLIGITIALIILKSKRAN